MEEVNAKIIEKNEIDYRDTSKLVELFAGLHNQDSDGRKIESLFNSPRQGKSCQLNH